MSMHDHENCDHNCDCDHEEDLITLTLDDGTEIKCTILNIFPVDDKEYIALLPIDDDSNHEVFIYRFIDNGDDEPTLENIDDDDEFEAVSDAFEEFLDSEEFDEFFDEFDVFDDESEDE